MYEDVGRYGHCYRSHEAFCSDYFAVNLSSLPRSYWEALFPKPYWPDLKKFSREQQPGSVSGGFSNPAGIGIQSQRRVE